jgi:hypothetical protein
MPKGGEVVRVDIVLFDSNAYRFGAKSQNISETPRPRPRLTAAESITASCKERAFLLGTSSELPMNVQLLPEKVQLLNPVCFVGAGGASEGFDVLACEDTTAESEIARDAAGESTATGALSVGSAAVPLGRLCDMFPVLSQHSLNEELDACGDAGFRNSNISTSPKPPFRPLAAESAPLVLVSRMLLRPSLPLPLLPPPTSTVLLPAVPPPPVVFLSACDDAAR